MITLRHEKPIPHKQEKSFLILDKPPGPSSHEVTAWTKKMLGVAKAGHSGTLDPKVTGVLVIALNKGTKLLRAFQNADKEYICIAKLEPMPPKNKLEQTLNKFQGYIKQMPPKEAAVARKLRKRIIYELELLEIKENMILFRVKCQHGTYIRVLVSDLARALGVKGTMMELRRTHAGTFSEDNAITMQELSDIVRVKKQEKVLLSPLEALSHIKKIWVGNKAVSALCHGANLAFPGVIAFDEGIKKGELVTLLTASNEVIGLANALKDSEEIQDAQGFVADTKAIILDKQLYPKHWKKD
ncbi:RNA-guided pseudouridylation complex pseudouridine synthase subunit Cbf5 [archaeon]|nr:RNA-guided pseudouridylation complex pseudouridine synthase subunit Cbf5 [archaeon]